MRSLSSSCARPWHQPFDRSPAISGSFLEQCGPPGQVRRHIARQAAQRAFMLHQPLLELLRTLHVKNLLCWPSRFCRAASACSNACNACSKPRQGGVIRAEILERLQRAAFKSRHQPDRRQRCNLSNHLPGTCPVKTPELCSGVRARHPAGPPPRSPSASPGSRGRTNVPADRVGLVQSHMRAVELPSSASTCWEAPSRSRCNRLSAAAPGGLAPPTAVSATGGLVCDPRQCPSGRRVAPPVPPSQDASAPPPAPPVSGRQSGPAHPGQSHSQTMFTIVSALAGARRPSTTSPGACLARNTACCWEGSDAAVKYRSISGSTHGHLSSHLPFACADGHLMRAVPCTGMPLASCLRSSRNRLARKFTVKEHRRGMQIHPARSRLHRCRGRGNNPPPATRRRGQMSQRVQHRLQVEVVPPANLIDGLQPFVGHAPQQSRQRGIGANISRSGSKATAHPTPLPCHHLRAHGPASRRAMRGLAASVARATPHHVTGKARSSALIPHVSRQ